jgi:peptide/nickel transport system substrate-binding protein
MNESQADKSASAGAANDDATKIQINVNSGADPDAIAPPVPGQVVNADAGNGGDEPAGSGDEEIAEAAEPTPPVEPSPADSQPAPTVIQPGAEPAPAANELGTAQAASPQPTITPAGMTATSEPPASTAPQVPVDTPAAASPPQIVTSHHGGGKSRWIKLFLLLVIIALLAVGGYFAYQKNHKTTKAVPSTAAVVKDIPVLKVGIEQAAYGGLYPTMPDTDDSLITNAQLFEGLVRYEAKGKIVPDLATKWTNPDNTTWLFTVRDGVKFHDGHTMTANDVKYSLGTVIASKSDSAQAFANTIASVDVVGANQVKITTTAPDPALLTKLSFLYVVDANLPQGDEPSQAGTGPYEIKPGTTPTATDLQMIAFDGYHGGRPTTRALAFGSAADSTTLMADYKAGTFNIIGPVTPSDAKSASSANQFVASSADVSFIGFNTVQSGPLQNKQVREAVRYAVNAAAIGQADDQSVAPDSQLLTASMPGYNPKITPYKQNLAKAKQLLTQAGYPSGVTVKFSTSDSVAKLAAIIAQLKQAGITLTVDQHSDPNEFANYVASGKAELYDSTSTSLDGLSAYTTVLPATNYSSAQFSGLVSQAGTTVDQAKQAKLLQAMAATVDTDIPVVPLYSLNTIWLTAGQYNLRQAMFAGPSVYFYQAHQ